MLMTYYVSRVPKRLIIRIAIIQILNLFSCKFVWFIYNPNAAPHATAKKTKDISLIDIILSIQKPHRNINIIFICLLLLFS